MRLNDESIQRAIQHHLRVGWSVCPELPAAAYAWAVDNNHLDRRRRDADGHLVSVRGGRHLTPPVICPKCIWPDEEQQNMAEEADRAIAALHIPVAVSFVIVNIRM